MEQPKQYQKLGENRLCLACGKSFYAQLSVIKKGKGKYCCLGCFFHGNKKLAQQQCVVCGKAFLTYPRLFKKHCSRACYGMAIGGNKHPRWNPLSSENKHARSSKLCKSWSLEIKKRDDFTCQLCGRRGGKLRSHHIKKFVSDPEYRLSPANGITICTDCEYRWIFYKESDWESYFLFNLETRGLLHGE